ncbi:MAG TPA: acyl carrier protein [Candidatus Eisenbacteria bacterium]|nr:acyl carrier protein [Candidatus Eisenbacteria bacterium]
MYPLVPPPTGRLGLFEFVEPVVRSALADHLGVEEILLAPDVSLTGDLAADSLDLLDVVIDLEERLAIAVPERDIDRVRSVSDLVHVVVTHLWNRDHPRIGSLPRRFGVAA